MDLGFAQFLVTVGQGLTGSVVLNLLRLVLWPEHLTWKTLQVPLWDRGVCGPWGCCFLCDPCDGQGTGTCPGSSFGLLPRSSRWAGNITIGITAVRSSGIFLLSDPGADYQKSPARLPCAFPGSPSPSVLSLQDPSGVFAFLLALLTGGGAGE